jgi:hypothetical protein
MKPVPIPKPIPIPKKNNTPIVIGDEWIGDDDSIPICDYCSVTMVKLVDRGGQNPSWFCNRCQISREPKETRKKSKLGIQKREIEPAVTSIQNNMADEVEIRHTPPIRGGFKELQDRGLKITSYKTNEKE